MPKRTPPKTPRQVFAEQMRAARERRGWTQQRLAAELRKLGHEIDHRTVSKMEQLDPETSRNVLLDDVFAIAAALGAAPLALLVPYETDRVAITPKRVVDAVGELVWLQGDMPLPGDRDDDHAPFYRDGTRRYDDVVRDRFPHLRQVRSWVDRACWAAVGVVGPKELKEIRTAVELILEDAPLIEGDIKRFQRREV